jgi:hypothetical protein
MAEDTPGPRVGSIATFNSVHLWGELATHRDQRSRQKFPVPAGVRDRDLGASAGVTILPLVPGPGN